MPVTHFASSFAEQKVFSPVDNPQAWLGSAVAVSGDVALVGAKNATVGDEDGQGIVYLYRKEGGSWRLAQTLVASDGAAGDHFGASIALFGSYAIISSPLARVNGKVWQGAAYVYLITGKACVQTQKLVAGNGAVFDTFGTFVRMDSAWAFISSGGANRNGSIVPYRVHCFRYVPKRNDGFWTEKLVLDAPDSDDRTNGFGSSIALYGSTVLIGSRSATIDEVPGSGAVYIYRYSPSTQWSLVMRVTSNDSAPRDNFGISVAFDGKEMLVGAHGATVDGNLSQGAVYRFNFRRGNWEQTQKILAKDGTAINLFGASVSLSENRLLVGAYAVDNYRGAAYMFAMKGGTWQLMKTLRASDGVSGDVFGYYSTLSTTDALVGAYAATINGNQKQGAAYFYALPQIGPDEP